MTFTAQRYNAVAQIFHWVMALIVIVIVCIGVFHESWSEATRASAMALHKSLGITVFVLAIARLGWRLAYSPPAYSQPLAGWQKWASKLTHWTFYALMIGLPIGGYVMSSPRGIAWFGVPLPSLPVERGSAIAGLAHEGHEYGGYLMGALILLHIGAALYHQLVDADNVFERMLPPLVRD